MKDEAYWCDLCFAGPFSKGRVMGIKVLEKVLGERHVCRTCAEVIASALPKKPVPKRKRK